MIRLKAKQDRIPMSEISERRKYQRVEKPIIIRFRIQPQKGQALEPYDWYVVGVNDLSARGLFFKNIRPSCLCLLNSYQNISTKKYTRCLF